MSALSPIPIAAAVPPQRGYPANAPTITLNQVGARLGVRPFGTARLVKYVGQLVRDHGFPRALPAPCKGKVVEGVHANSQWVRAAVDHWFDGFIPAEAHAAMDEAALAEAAHEMDARAANLRIVR